MSVERDGTLLAREDALMIQAINRTSTRRFLDAAVVLVLAIAAMHCSEPVGRTSDSDDLAGDIAEAVLISGVSTQSSGTDIEGATLLNGGAALDTVYLSFRPGSLPNATRLELANSTRSLAPVQVDVKEGGVDPVAIGGREGDSISITTWLTDGRNIVTMVKIPAKRPASVVRSKPPRGRSDVALNVVITVVFTEPVNRSTVTASSLRLMRGETAIPGKLVFHEEAWLVDFVPDQPLRPRSEHVLIATRDITDRSGGPLDSTYTAAFETGTSVCEAGDSNCGANLDPTFNIVSGTVMQFTQDGRREPIPEAEVSAWVRLPDGTDYQLHQKSDASGRYQFGSLPQADVAIRASAPGLEQHCGVETRTYTKMYDVLDILLAPPGDFRDVELSRATTNFRSFSEGHTLEVVGWRTDGIAQYGARIPGAMITWEAPEGFVRLRATTDSNGSYLVCGIPSTPLAFSIVKQGFKTIQVPSTKWILDAVYYFGLQREQ